MKINFCFAKKNGGGGYEKDTIDFRRIISTFIISYLISDQTKWIFRDPKYTFLVHKLALRKNSSILTSP